MTAAQCVLAEPVKFTAENAQLRGRDWNSETYTDKLLRRCRRGECDLEYSVDTLMCLISIRLNKLYRILDLGKHNGNERVNT